MSLGQHVDCSNEVLISLLSCYNAKFSGGLSECCLLLLLLLFTSVAQMKHGVEKWKKYRTFCSKVCTD